MTDATNGGLPSSEADKPAFYAHSLSDRPEADWEPLSDHLRRTAALAEEFAAAFGAGGWGHAAGLLHDAGKYRAAFQARIRGGKHQAEHAAIGALIAKQAITGGAGPVLGYAVAGHHAGLPDGGDGGEASLGAALTRAQDLSADMAPYAEKGLLPSRLAPPQALRGQPVDRQGFALHLFTRMLFSALCDADFLCTEDFCAPDRGQARREPFPALGEIESALTLHLERLAEKAHAQARTEQTRKILEARTMIGDACRTKAALPPGVFSLSVPTGGGKTFASLAFALAHARQHALRRVIYVIPYTSIIEQTAREFREALGPGLARGVLEHHSAVAPPPEGQEPMGPDRLKLAAENWSHPLIVTTTVQFFESLFAARPSQCRKLHNIANSVIILDEVQTLPLPLLQASVAALEQLTGVYGCTVLLCSATQPDLRHTVLSWGLPPVREIVDDIPRLFSTFARCRAENAGPLTDAALVARLKDEPQVLCIVDQRAHAADLFTALGGRDSFHLSAGMCPAHRRVVLEEVRRRLKAGEPCRLAATSVIEAGVDVSFPAVYRAIAGIDSLTQAAGRCNRHGELAEGRFVVFESDRPLWLPDLQRRRELARPLLTQGTDPLDRATVGKYFDMLFALEGLDTANIMRLCSERAREAVWPFREIAEKYRIIGEDTVPVIVPYADADILCDRLELCARNNIPPSLDKVLRPLQQVSVAVYRNAFQRLDLAGAIARIGPDGRFLRLVRPEFYGDCGLRPGDTNRSPDDNIF